MFDPAGSYIQDIMIEEAAACADALSRDAARRAVAALAGIGGGGRGGGGSDGTGSALLRVEPGDDEALENVRELVAFLADAASASAAAAGVRQRDQGLAAASYNSRGLAGAASSARRLAVALRDLRPVAPALAAGIARVAEGIARALADSLKEGDPRNPEHTAERDLHVRRRGCRLPIHGSGLLASGEDE